MTYDNKAWLTLFDSNYQENQYLYHFTNVESAIKILFNRTLKFSKICKTNDTLESKPKLQFPEIDEQSTVAEIRNYLTHINTNRLQLLCFTDDFPKRSGAVDEQQLFCDYSGRGFSLPRMWAQYANNNCGICLVFNHGEISELINDELESALIKEKKIVYYSQFESFDIPQKVVDKILKKIDRLNSGLEKDMISVDFLKNNSDIVDYCYFSKLDDWQGENEYRFLAYGDEDYFIHDIDKALKGVIIGERISSENQEIIQYFCEDMCEVKKITFTCNGCSLINIHK